MSWSFMDYPLSDMAWTPSVIENFKRYIFDVKLPKIVCKCKENIYFVWYKKGTQKAGLRSGSEGKKKKS